MFVGLEAEYGRSKERERLQAALDRASKNLEAPPPPPANTDAAALRRYLLAVSREPNFKSMVTVCVEGLQ